MENAIGSSTGVIDETLARIDWYLYDGYGITDILRQGEYTPFKYVGKHGYYSDGDSGMILLGHRYYMPDLGKFLTQDPIGHDAGLNLYLYVHNNPLIGIDPTGMDDESILGQLGQWSTWSEGLKTSGAALLHTVSFGIYDGGRYRNAPGFQESALAWNVAIAAGTGAIGAARTAGSSAVGTAAARLAANRAAGKAAEGELLELVGGTSQVGIRTAAGELRVVDVLSNGVAHEAKVGYTTLTSSVRSQIAKDAALKATGDIRGAVWHFFRSSTTGRIGASPSVLNALQKAGIQYVIH